MCGIAGIVHKSGEPVAPERIREMTRVATHRGPDGEGFYHAPGLAFGHRRLSIQDLSDAGHQPLIDGASGCAVTFNGEIYNFIELRAELEALGRVFASRCDTEVLLQAYLEWGEACVARFNGMWAFAIHDPRRRVVFCSRDRFGVKPLYYLDDARRFGFASELKQLLPLLDTVAANPDALLGFLITKITDAGAATFYRDLHKLLPGHNLRLDLTSGRVDIERWYHLTLDPALAELDPDAAARRYREALEQSVTLRLRSDVPVGTCLSGGLDSSSVAMLAARRHHAMSDRPFAAITAVSTQRSNDESAYAKRVVEAGGMRWLTVRPSYEDFSAAIDAVVWAQEEPFGGPSVIMQHFVMRTAREHGITVLLDGQGGDETLLGYEKYYTAYLVAVWRRNGMGGLLRATRDILNSNDNMSLRRLAMYLVAGLSWRARYRYYRGQHDYLRSWPEAPDHLRAYGAASRDIETLQRLENEVTNLPILLRYEDKNSMAHSIETRLPFLDYRALETALSLPHAFKIHDGWTKWLLRRGMSDVLPPEIAWRRDKRGFEAPEGEWLVRHHDSMREAVRRSDVLARLADPTRLARRFDTLDARSRWRLYSIALWEQRFGVAA